MDLKIKDMTALVTGSTQGLGFATAKKLCEEGCHVYINGRNKKNVDDAIKRIISKNANAQIKGIVADLSTNEGCTTLTEKLPSIDILINNLGIFKPVDFEKITENQWLEMFQTNVLSGARLSQYYFPKMLDNNWGRVIFISSESAYQIPKEMIHYGVTKTAQLSLARGIAELTKGTNVTSNSIILGPSNSEGVTDFLNDYAASQNKTFDEMEKEFFQEVRPTSLLQRFTDVNEVANLVVYTASPLSSASNGAVLRADAGVVQAAF